MQNQNKFNRNVLIYQKIRVLYKMPTMISFGAWQNLGSSCQNLFSYESFINAKYLEWQSNFGKRKNHYFQYATQVAYFKLMRSLIVFLKRFIKNLLIMHNQKLTQILLLDVQVKKSQSRTKNEQSHIWNYQVEIRKIIKQIYRRNSNYRKLYIFRNCDQPHFQCLMETAQFDKISSYQQERMRCIKDLQKINEGTLSYIRLDGELHFILLMTITNSVYTRSKRMIERLSLKLGFNVKQVHKGPHIIIQQKINQIKISTNLRRKQQVVTSEKMEEANEENGSRIKGLQEL